MRDANDKIQQNIKNDLNCSSFCLLPRKILKISKSKKTIRLNYTCKMSIPLLLTYKYQSLNYFEYICLVLFMPIYQNSSLAFFCFFFLGSIMLKCSFDAVLYTIKVMWLYDIHNITYTPKECTALIFK